MCIVENLAHNVILGIDFFQAKKANIDNAHGKLSIKNNFLAVPLNCSNENEHRFPAKNLNTCFIPPNHEVNISVKVLLKSSIQKSP